MQFSSIWPIDRTLSGTSTPGSEWTWKRWQWKSALHSSKLQHYQNLNIRLFSVMCRTLVGGGGVLPFCRDVVSVYFSNQDSDWLALTACQPVEGYFRVRESCSLYVHIYIFFLVSFLKSFFANSPIEWNPNRYYHSRSEWTWKSW